jgi:nitrate/nitrite-specific signal transduction histidine kinase
LPEDLPNIDDLILAFGRIREELHDRTHIEFRAILEGRPRALKASIRDEVYRIGREALLNAFRHSEARRIEVQLEYAPKCLRMAVRDDGKGIPPHIFQAASSAYAGLSLMHQAAERIGARLRLFSREAAGTEVELLIPEHLAFVEARLDAL